MGKPKGLTRKAIMRTMIPLVTESVKRMMTPKMPVSVPMIPNTTEDRFSKNANIQIIIARTATNGAASIFKRTLMLYSSNPFYYNSIPGKIVVRKDAA
jgi:hypothetical protein